MPGNLISQNDKCKDLKRIEKIQFGATKPQIHHEKKHLQIGERFH